LFEIDVAFSKEAQRQGCPACGGPLCLAAWWRNPGDEPAKLPDECRKRLGLCCCRDGCRKRVLPPSCLFFGRKTYWGAIVLLVVLAKARREEGYTARRLQTMFGVSRDTIRRWIRMFREQIPTSSWWQRIRGLLGPEVRDDALPGSLLDSFMKPGREAEEALVACLRFLATAREGPAGPAG
jgi:hypothetical protein